MSIHNIAKAQGLTRTDTTKLFWGTYAFSLKTTIPEEFHEERRERLHQFWIKAKTEKWTKVRPTLGQIHGDYRQTLQDHIDKIVEDNLAILSVNAFYHNSGDKNTIFYLKSKEAAEALLADNVGLFHTYSAPSSDAVHAHLLAVADEKVEVRERGWYGEFDHKIVFKWQAKYHDLDNRVEALQFEDSLYSKGENRILYVSGDDDFFLAKLALSERIDSVTRCVTADEINNK